MQTKSVIMFGQPAVLVCDANCNKAWGVSLRPKEQLSEDEDDVAYLADGELGDAPTAPGTYEGGFTKPSRPDQMNKWCARECERCDRFEPGQELKALSFAVRLFNQPWKHDGSSTNCAAA